METEYQTPESKDAPSGHSPAGGPRQNGGPELLRLERLASLGGMVAGLSHELAAPLTVIANAAETALEFGESDAETKSCLRVMRDEALRLGKLLHGMLLFARAGTSGRRAVDAAAAAEGVVRMLRYHRVRGDVRLVFEAETGLPPVSGDDALIRQVFFNLIKNACDASDECGEVRISVRLRAAAQADGRAAVVCEVADRGRGVPAGDLARVFEPFFSTKEGGVGLGLALARDIVEEHGGSIFLTNRPGGGALARVSLPVLLPAAPRNDPQTKLAAPP
jgi:signal transduction histidine kinase